MPIFSLDDLEEETSSTTQAGTFSLSDLADAPDVAPARAISPGAAERGTPPRKKKAQIEAGNIDLYAQPKVKNPDGTTSTVDSSSYNIDGHEVLLPSVTPDGRHLKTTEDILKEYRKTGRHLGIFDSPESATAFAKQLHEDYAAGKYDKAPETARQISPGAAERGERPRFQPPAFVSAESGADAFDVHPGIPADSLAATEIEGATRIATGAKNLGTRVLGAAKATATTALTREAQAFGAERPAKTEPVFGRKSAADLNQILEGALQLATPALVVSGALAPIGTAASLVVGAGTKDATHAALIKAGVSKEVADLVSTVTSIAVLSAGTTKAVKSAVGAVGDVAETAVAGVGKAARGAALATKLSLPPEVQRAAGGYTSPVSSVVKAGIHAPIEAVEAGGQPSMEFAPGGGESLTDVLRNSPVADALRTAIEPVRKVLEEARATLYEKVTAAEKAGKPDLEAARALGALPHPDVLGPPAPVESRQSPVASDQSGEFNLSDLAEPSTVATGETPFTADVRRQAGEATSDDAHALLGTEQNVPPNEAAQQLEADRTAEPTYTAKFLGYQPTADGGAIPLYNVFGNGPKDKSTVGVSGLEALGIAVPETPKVEDWTPQKPATVRTNQLPVEADAPVVKSAREALQTIRAHGFDIAEYHTENGWLLENRGVSDTTRATGGATTSRVPADVTAALKVFNRASEDDGATLINEKPQPAQASIPEEEVAPKAEWELREDAIANAVKESKKAGKTHLDSLPMGVEALRGKRFKSLRDGQDWIARTVDSRGTVYFVSPDGKATEEISGTERGEFVLKASSPKDYAIAAKANKQQREAESGVAPRRTKAQNIPRAHQPEAGADVSEAGRPSLRRVAPSTPARGESPRQQASRRARHYADVFKAVLAHAKQIDPTVSKADLQREFDARIALVDEADTAYRESGQHPRTLLEAIAKAGGINLDSEKHGGYRGELQRAREGVAGPHGNFAGVPNVFRARTTGSRGETLTGHGLDDMVRLLNQSHAFAHIQDIPDLMAALDDVARMGDVGAKGTTYPGTDELAKSAGITAGEPWWKDSWQAPNEPQPLTADTYQQAFGGSKAQAQAIVKVYEAMGLDLSRVFVTKGGGAGDLEQGAEAQTDSPAFKTWFGDSKVVDADGNPLVVYHGTTRAFQQFKYRHGLGGRLGFWFSSTPEGAEPFQTVRVPSEDKPVTMPVFLSIQNPFEFTEWMALVDAGFKFQGSIEQRMDSLRRSLIRKGHDGVVIRNSDTDRGGLRDDWVAFKPAQIKSATGNRGTFDPTKANILYQPAYHGSPYSFKKFSLQHIGSGEGAQAYGWGLYFASRKEVAEEYRRRLARSNSLNDEQLAEFFTPGRIVPGYGGHDRVLSFTPATKDSHWRVRVQEITRRGNEWVNLGLPRTHSTMPSGDEYAKATGKKVGHTYEVEIPENADFLDWDKPVSQQSTKVKTALKKLGIAWGDSVIPAGHRGYVSSRVDDPTGEQIYRWIVNRHPERVTTQSVHGAYSGVRGSAEAASKALASQGVAGIRYLDQLSRTAGEGTHNYVVFDDNLVKITNVLNQGPKASVEFTEDGHAIVRALSNPDVSSGLHEAGHVARRFLFDRALPVDVREGVTDEDILTAEEWAGAKDGEWDRAAEEKFARGFERYFHDGQAPTPTLKSLFAKFAAWLSKIYKALKGSSIDVDISDAMRQVFDRLVTRTERLREAEATGDTSFDTEALDAKGPLYQQDNRYGKGTSQAYIDASEAASEAERTFSDVTRRYRAKEIGDAEYLAARKVRDSAAKAFDAAYAAEEARGESKADVLPTGEEQPRLPDVWTVREQDVKTPEFEAPFSLTGEVSTAKKGKQDTLFQEEEQAKKRQAAFFTEDVLPAKNEIVRQFTENAKGLQVLFAPSTVSSAAETAAGLVRSSAAIQWQHAARARKILMATKKEMDRLYGQKAAEGDKAAQERFMRLTDAAEGVMKPTDLTPIEEAFVAWAKQALSSKRDEAIKIGLMTNYLEFYFPHEWADPEKATSVFARRPLQGRESYRKRRTIPTVREGIDLGLEPTSWNPVDLVLHKLVEMDKSIEARRLLRKTGKQSGISKFFRVGHKLPDGWKFYPDSIATVYAPPLEGQTFGRVVAGKYAGPADAVRILERYLSPGLSGRVAAYDLYRGASNLFVQLKLSLSLFHAMTTGLESMVSKMSLAMELVARGQYAEAERKAREIPVAPFVDLWRGSQWLKEMYANDAVAGAIHGIANEIVLGGGQIGWDHLEHSDAPAKFMEAIRKGNYPGAAFRAIPATIEALAWPIMSWWVPRLKIAAFHERAQMELQSLGPNPDLAEVRRVLGQAWATVDDRFGEIVYRNWFWFTTMKEIGQSSLLSLGWNGGSLKLLTGAIPGQMARMGLAPGAGGRGGLGKRPQRRVNTNTDKRGKPIYEMRPESPLHPAMAWFVSLMVVGGLVNAMYQLYMTGEAPKEPMDVVMPRNGRKNVDGSDQRVFLPGYMKDVLAWTTHPLVTAAHKVHPFLRFIADSIENTDYKNVQYRNTDDPFATQFKDWLAFTLQEMEPISYTKLKQSGWESLLGINPAPRAMTQSKAEAKLSEIQDRRGESTLTKRQAEVHEQRLKLREGLRAKTPAGRQDAKDAIQSGDLTEGQIVSAAKGSQQSYLQRGFASLPLEDGLAVYELATPAERRSLYGALVGKWVRAPLPPADRKRLDPRVKAALKLPRAGTVTVH